MRRAVSFEDRTYLVTGGGSGIGKGVAEGLAKAGANVMIVGRNADRLTSAADEISAGAPAGEVNYQPADVTNEDQIAAVVDAATAWTGRLHGVVHCAGGWAWALTQIDSEASHATVDLNVDGSMYVLKHSARQMVRGGGGSFVGISSIAASNTHRWFGPYGVTKAGLDHLVKLAADELGPSWVRVNGIRPGLIRTELVQLVLDSPELSGDYRDCTPLPRPGEVAKWPTWRCSCSAMPPSGSPGRSSASTAGRTCGADRTIRRCWSLPSAPTAYAEWSEPAAASRAARLPTADQSRCSPPLANSVRKRSRRRLAIGSGTRALLRR